MKLQVFGTGCPKCNKLAEVTEQAAREAAVDFTLEKITDMNAIMAEGIMMTPALKVNGETIVAGRIPTVSELQSVLLQSAGARS